MPGSKKGSRPNNGGARLGGVTRPIIKRIPDLFDKGIELSVPYEMRISGLQLGKCAVCGAVWWSDYTINAHTVLPGDEEDENGAHWPEVARIEVKGQPEKHKHGCPMK